MNCMFKSNPIRSETLLDIEIRERKIRRRGKELENCVSKLNSNLIVLQTTTNICFNIAFVIEFRLRQCLSQMNGSVLADLALLLVCDALVVKSCSSYSPFIRAKLL